MVNDEAPEGTVVDQSPAAGGQVRIGSRVSVTVATQGETVPVPDVRLRTEAEFFAILAQNNLAPGQRAEAYDPEVPATLIVRTNPRQGVEVARGTSIDYVVSLGPMPTPTPSPLPTDTPLTPPPSNPLPTETPTEPPTAAPTPSPIRHRSPRRPRLRRRHRFRSATTCCRSWPTSARLRRRSSPTVCRSVSCGPTTRPPTGSCASSTRPRASWCAPGTLVHLFVKPPFDAC